MAKSTRPKDANQLAKMIADIATGEVEDKEEITPYEIKSAAATLGRLGGLKGGDARAKKLSPEKRKEIAAKAAKARWDKKD